MMLSRLPKPSSSSLSILRSFSSAPSTTATPATSNKPEYNLKQYGNVLGGTALTPSSSATFTKWHQCLSLAMQEGSKFNADDFADAMRPHVHTKCEFHPPTYWNKWEGKEEFLCLLGCVSEVFGPSFKYGRQWLSDDGKNWCLEFSAEIGTTKKLFEGVDLITLNDAGEIVEMRVQGRPPNAALKDEMMAKVPQRMAKVKAKAALNNLNPFS